LRIRITLLRIRIQGIFNFTADTDPAPHQSDANLQPMVFRPSRVPF
jgi:hypothetical protein